MLQIFTPALETCDTYQTDPDADISRSSAKTQSKLGVREHSIHRRSNSQYACMHAPWELCQHLAQGKPFILQYC